MEVSSDGGKWGRDEAKGNEERGRGKRENEGKGKGVRLHGLSSSWCYGRGGRRHMLSGLTVRVTGIRWSGDSQRCARSSPRMWPSPAGCPSAAASTCATSRWYGRGGAWGATRGVSIESDPKTPGPCPSSLHCPSSPHCPSSLHSFNARTTEGDAASARVHVHTRPERPFAHPRSQHGGGRAPHDRARPRAHVADLPARVHLPRLQGEGGDVGQPQQLYQPVQPGPSPGALHRLFRAASDRILACSFKQINYWVVTEIVYTRVLSKRVQTIKKFIKLAAVGRRAQPAFCSRAER